VELVNQQLANVSTGRSLMGRFVMMGITVPVGIIVLLGFVVGCTLVVARETLQKIFMWYLCERLW
jgi:hypothetical protein